MKLPAPRDDGPLSLESVLAARRTVREYRADHPLLLADLAQLLWSGQGVTSPEEYRAAPSAAALYPIDLYVVAGMVDGLDAGIYRYLPSGHELVAVSEGDRRKDVVAVSFDHGWMADCPAHIVLNLVVDRMTPKFGEMGLRFALLEAGHIAQNLLLQAVSLGLGAAPICAYDGPKLKTVLGLGGADDPAYLITVGHGSS